MDGLHCQNCTCIDNLLHLHCTWKFDDPLRNGRDLEEERTAITTVQRCRYMYMQLDRDEAVIDAHKKRDN